MNLRDRITLKPGTSGYPPTSGGGAYLVTAIDHRGRFCVDGMETWLEADRVASINGEAR
ncbi:hypothetical protein WG907_05275 [Sphingobium sp. AN558]|uniref:hypothetical protein n=1 Tax=Sphingobium sp. AN558 TaxID=3133442 RepID=UPI0030BDF210